MGRDMTLSRAAWAKDSLLRNVVLVLAGTAFIAAAAKISVPLGPVPMSLQTLAILLVGFAFGSRLGAVTLIAYLAEGAMGLPMFTPSTLPGTAAFAGPTAGFLVGFVFMAWAAGWAAERGIAKGFLGTAVAAIVISALLYIPGLVWPLAVAGSFGIAEGWAGAEFAQTWVWFAGPFLLGDAIKAVLAALIVTGAWAALKSRNA